MRRIGKSKKEKGEADGRRRKQKEIEEIQLHIHSNCYSVPESWQMLWAAQDFTVGLCAWAFSYISVEPTSNFGS